MNDQRGAALLLVLWALALLSALMASAVALTRLENLQSAYELNHSRALSNAQAGLALAIDGLLLPAPGTWITNGVAHELNFDGTTLSVSVRNERGKLDLNAASPEALRVLLRQVGANAEQIQQLPQQLQMRQATGQPLQAIELLQTFTTMDQTLYARLIPDVTLWSGLAVPDPAYASPTVRTALALPAINTLMTSSDNAGSVVDVHSRARLANGFSAQLNVVLQLNPAGGNAPLYRVLRWQE
jgi:general secretion pathway protein K